MQDSEIICLFSLLSLREKRLSIKYSRIKGWKKIYLESIFLKIKYPNSNLRNNISLVLGVSTKAVQIWIQNRRNRYPNYKLPDELYSNVKHILREIRLNNQNHDKNNGIKSLTELFFKIQNYLKNSKGI